MGNEDVESAAVMGPVQYQAREQAKSPEISLSLCVLIRSIGTVENGTAESADQESFMARRFQVQVRTAFDVCKILLRIVGWIVVSGHVQQRHVQERDQILKVRVGEITASENQFDVPEMPAAAQAVQPFDDLVAYRKDVHNGRIVPQNDAPCKGFSSESNPGAREVGAFASPGLS